jgi:hypothetical protein
LAFNHDRSVEVRCKTETNHDDHRIRGPAGGHDEHDASDGPVAHGA